MKDLLKTPYNRTELIDYILANDSEDYSCHFDLVELAKANDSELAGRVHDIIAYQEREEKVIDKEEVVRELVQSLWEESFEAEQYIKALMTEALMLRDIEELLEINA